MLLNFFLKSDHSPLDLPSPTTDVSHLGSEGCHPDHQHHYHLSHHQQNKAQFITKFPPTCPPRSWKRSSACLSKEASWRIAWHRVWFVTHSLKEHCDDRQFGNKLVLILPLDWVCLTWRLPQLLALCRREQLETQAGWPEASFPLLLVRVLVD